MSDKLKPCPFCGGNARHNKEGFVECCFCGGMFDGSPDGWNRRTHELNTSVIRWTRYDGTVETLPKTNVIMIDNGHFHSGYQYDGIWYSSVAHDGGFATLIRKVEIGDLWSYLTTPEPVIES